MQLRESDFVREYPEFYSNMTSHESIVYSFAVECTVSSIIMCSVVYSAQCTVYSVHCTVYSVQCTVFTVHSNISVLRCHVQI